MTSSGPGWSSFLTGVWREKHGVRENGFRNANFKEFPHLLDRYKKARPEGFVASVVHWAPIQQHLVTKADHTSAHKNDAEVTTKALEILREKKLDILFVHFDEVDGAGHRHGFHPKNDKYLAAISEVDERIGRLLEGIKARPTHAQEDWLIVVSTDHGGSGKGHGRNEPEHRTIFFLVSGKSAAKGKIEPPPGIVDVTPTVLRHVGVEIEERWKLDGKAVGLR
jgi:predicted AlkP superfamily pyrophosphatase or phosphodiesterase